jgi:hypothetical protein
MYCIPVHMVRKLNWQLFCRRDTRPNVVAQFLVTIPFLLLWLRQGENITKGWHHVMFNQSDWALSYQLVTTCLRIRGQQKHQSYLLDLKSFCCRMHRLRIPEKQIILLLLQGVKLPAKISRGKKCSVTLQYVYIYFVRDCTEIYEDTENKM